LDEGLLVSNEADTICGHQRCTEALARVDERKSRVMSFDSSEASA
jgi:hypothetical protein